MATTNAARLEERRTSALEANGSGVAMKSIERLAIVLTAVMLALVVTSPASAAPPPQAQDRAEHDRIVRYWTPDRVQRAIPRDLTVQVGARPDLEKGKPGSGGGGSTTVTGAHWTGTTAVGSVRATVGKVLFTLGGVNYVCSGSVANEANPTISLILTAGHCTYDSSGFATNWMFVPDYEYAKTFACDATRFGCWTAAALVTTQAWADGDFNEDYAFVVVGAGGKSTQSVQLDATVGANPIAFNLSHPRPVYAFGYPQATPYNGQTLTYCAGTDVSDVWGGSTDYGLNCNMTGGSSGGPWFSDFNAMTGTGTLTSLNSFKYRGSPTVAKYMFGPYFDGYTQATYAAAQAATGNTLVDAP